jgi:hypothetical protein
MGEGGMTEAVSGGEPRSGWENAAEQFRKLALALAGAEEHEHHGAPDFRIGGRIFATLAYAAKGKGTLMLAPEQQAEFLAEAAESFMPASGAWGRNGSTLVRLDAPAAVIAGALASAHRHVLAKTRATSRLKAEGTSRRSRRA